MADGLVHSTVCSLARRRRCPFCVCRAAVAAAEVRISEPNRAQHTLHRDRVSGKPNLLLLLLFLLGFLVCRIFRRSQFVFLCQRRVSESLILLPAACDGVFIEQFL